MLKLHCLAAFIIISFSQALSQNQQIADSLVKVYYQQDEGDSGRLRLLSEIAFFQTHPDSILKYAKLLIDLADQNSEPFWMNKGVFYRGSANQLKGNYDLAFADFFTTLNYDIETNNQKGISQSSLVIANTYSSLGDSRNAVNYYKKVVSQSRAISDTLTLATALYNAGDEYLNAQKPDSALVFFMEASYIFNQMDYAAGQAYSLGSMGMVYAGQDNYEHAEISLLNAIEFLEALGDGYAICAFELEMVQIYFEKNEMRLAREYAKRAYRRAVEEGFKEQIRDAAEKLSEIHEHLGQSSRALAYLKIYNVFRDSMNNEAVIQKMADLRREFEVSQATQGTKSKSVEKTTSSEEKNWTSAKYYALVIGMNDYLFSSAELVDLDRPILDARALATALSTNYKFEEENMVVLENATRSEVIEAFETISRSITVKDNLLIFYAGHGVWDENLELGYWLPADATTKSKVNWISNSTIRDYISGLKTKHTLLISDACFSGSIFKSRQVKETLDGFGFYKVYKMPSRKAMTSGTLNTVPDRSYFMEHLVRSLKENKNEYLLARQLFASMETAVINNTRNIPQYGTIQGAGDEGGDFIFIRKERK